LSEELDPKEIIMKPMQQLAGLLFSLVLPGIASANSNVFTLENPSPDQDAALKQLIHDGVVSPVDGCTDFYEISQASLEAVTSEGETRVQEIVELLKQVAGDAVMVKAVPLSEARIGTQDRDGF
jgi:hypothetical protein